MKYHNKQTTCRQGHNHASLKEGNRCNDLVLLAKAGIIKDLVQQPKFNLLHDFLWHGKKVRGIDYVADFSYYDNEKKKFAVEDTKGFKTAVYLLKKKMLLNIMKTRDDFVFIES